MTNHDTATIAAILPETHDFFHFPREDRKGGGVGAAISKNLGSVKSVNLTFNSFECIEINVSHKNKKLSFYVIYRPPQGSPILTFFEEFSSFLTESQMANEMSVYVGDFNIWMNDKNDLRAIEMYNILDIHSLKNYVHSPTHKSGNTLDLILTNSHCDFISNVLVEPTHTISDHRLIYFEINFDKPDVYKKTIKYRNVKHFNSENFSNNLQNKFDLFKTKNDCPHSSSIVSDQCVACLTEFYRHTTSEFFELNAPVVIKEIISSRSNDLNKWYDSVVQEAKKKVRKAEKNLYRNPNEENRAEFIRLRDWKGKLVDETKKKFYTSKVVACGSDYGELYRVLNHLVGRDTASAKLPTYSDAKALAENFKDFFIKKVEDINSSIAQSVPESVSHIPDFPLVGLSQFHPVTEDNVREIIRSMNKTNCCNDPFVMKMLDLPVVLASLCAVIKDIINASFSSGIFPESEKHAIVRPLIKGTKDKDEFSSYRPLFNTTLLAKFLEKACLVQLQEYLNNFEAIPKNQSAYKKFHSVETALCRIYNDLIISKANGNCTMLIALDLSAAFDTVVQRMLLDDLKNLGIGGSVLNWFQTYLIGRTFSVEICGENSDAAIMKTGVCQGTILAPVLFTIYTMELSYVLRDLGVSCHFYSDDTQILLNIETESQACEDFNNIFSAISKWMSKRKLKLNANKTECIIFGHKTRLNTLNSFKYVKLDNLSKIDFVDKIKDLGIIFDQHLTMETQILNVRAKAIGNLINISRISKYIDKDSRLKLVYGLVLSRVDFCNSLYANLPKYQVRKLQIIINDAARLVCNVVRFSRDRVTPLCIQLHFLPIKARIMYKICLLTYKILMYGQPSYLADLIKYRTTSRPLRSNTSLQLHEPIIAQTNYSDRCFAYCAPRFFNELPESVRLSTSVAVFKSRLKTFIFTEAYDLENLRIRENFVV